MSEDLKNKRYDNKLDHLTKPTEEELNIISDKPGTPYRLRPLGKIRDDAKKIFENPYRYTPQEAMEGKGDYVGGKHYNRLPDHFQPAEISHAWGLDFLLWNTVKYLSRAGHKEDSNMSTTDKEIDDLKKAIDYIRMRINVLEGRTPLDFGIKSDKSEKPYHWLDEPMDSFMERWNSEEVIKAMNEHTKAKSKPFWVETNEEFYKRKAKEDGVELGELDDDGIPL